MLRFWGINTVIMLSLTELRFWYLWFLLQQQTSTRCQRSHTNILSWVLNKIVYTFLIMLAVPNNADFWINSILISIPRLSIYSSNFAVIVPNAPTTIGITTTFFICHNLAIHLLTSCILYSILSRPLSHTLVSSCRVSQMRSTGGEDSFGKMAKNCLKMTKLVFWCQKRGETWRDKPIFWQVGDYPPSHLRPLGESLQYCHIYNHCLFL